MNEINGLNLKIKTELLRLGADIVGFGSLLELPENIRRGLPNGICVAVKYPREIIRGIGELPTEDYRVWYDRLNERLDMIVTMGAEFLIKSGFNAAAQTRERAGTGETENNTVLPHKTVATRAGIGWIGKCALLVTDDFGSAIRISAILTDAPVEAAKPVNESKCGGCMVCANACPAGAVSGKLWGLGIYRDEFFDAVKCRRAANERSLAGFGKNYTICGKCIEVCPRTRRYTNE